MSQIMDRVISDIEHLSASEKSFVAQCILSSLDNHQDSDALHQWEELSKKRYDELKSGKVQAVSWEEIKSKVVGK
ncbi:MAG: addiction module protein [Campylobacterota bacterium]|nr:addiction module protein [Campylobacterota bacterium]